VAKSFGDPLRPMSGDVGELAQSGRLPALLCQLARDRFTGLVYAERQDSGAVFSFRDGRAVFVEDLENGQTIPDMLLERGLVSAQQYNDIATLVLESLAENEDLSFCQHAVQLQVLTQAQIDQELERWIRGRIIRAVGWEECRIEIDSDPEAVTGTLEYPQAVGPLVYMGVRTFYDEARVRATLGHDGDLYVRLTRPIDEAAELFSLEADEVSLLSSLRSDIKVERMIDDSSADPLEAWQLLCMLRLASMVELGSAPLSPTERSGVRSTHAITEGHVARGATGEDGRGSQARIPVAREERAQSQGRMPAAREERAESQGRMPAAREERAESQGRIPAARADRVASQPRVAVPREDRDPTQPFTPLPREERAGSQARMSAVREERGATGPQHSRPMGSQSGHNTRYSSSRMPAIQDEQVSQPPPPSAPQPRRAVTAPVKANDAGAKTPAPAEVPPRAQPFQMPTPRERRRPRKLSATLKQLDRELKQLRTSAAVAAEPAASASMPTQSAGHIDQLVRMRQATIAQQKQMPQGQVVAARNAAELFRSAQEALREQQFGRAQEIMRKACEAEPKNEIYSMYCMWAELRSNVLREEGLTKLRQILREKISDDQHKGFAYYALGHIALYEKKEEAAEKFFRKAVELDKHNKDAERHLRVLELRRKTAAGQEKSGKIFGIDIKSKKS
jgi:hypothetical protein